MAELYELLEPLIGTADGFTRDAYEYADGNVETLLSYYAIRSPHDDPVEVLRKQRVTALMEIRIGELITTRELEGAEKGLNPRGSSMLSRWHEQKCHVLTTNYDTIVERIAADHKYEARDYGYKLSSSHLYPIAINSARTRGGESLGGSGQVDTLTLYKLHGSASWFKSAAETTFDPIYGLSHTELSDPGNGKYIADKRRFIIPPVYDKSSLLNHETIRSLWLQAKDNALRQADKLYVIGYSLPETDTAMHTLLWEGAKGPNGVPREKKLLYVVDVDEAVSQRYSDKLGRYYDVRDCYAGGDDAFDRFVDDYTGE